MQLHYRALANILDALKEQLSQFASLQHAKTGPSEESKTEVCNMPMQISEKRPRESVVTEKKAAQVMAIRILHVHPVLLTVRLL